jgi:hypothetical protein
MMAITTSNSINVKPLCRFIAFPNYIFINFSTNGVTRTWQTLVLLP